MLFWSAIVVTHLIQNRSNGWVFDEGELFREIEKAVNYSISLDSSTRIKNRISLAESNSEFLSYDQICLKILDSVKPLL